MQADEPGFDLPRPAKPPLHSRTGRWHRRSPRVTSGLAVPVLGDRSDDRPGGAPHPAGHTRLAATDVHHSLRRRASRSPASRRSGRRPRRPRRRPRRPPIEKVGVPVTPLTRPSRKSSRMRWSTAGSWRSARKRSASVPAGVTTGAARGSSVLLRQLRLRATRSSYVRNITRLLRRTLTQDLAVEGSGVTRGARGQSSGRPAAPLPRPLCAPPRASEPMTSSASGSSTVARLPLPTSASVCR